MTQISQSSPSNPQADSSHAEMLDTVTTVVSEKLRVDRELLTPEFTLDELGLDSLTSAEVVLAIEKKLGLKLDFEGAAVAFDRDTTLSQFVDLVVQLVQEAR